MGDDFIRGLSIIASGADSVENGAIALEDDNEWNTYVRTGLPATPIASPSDAAIKAAMQPAEAHPPASVQAAAGRPWLVIQVSDRGRGMSASEAAACFTAGVAAPAAVGGGTGLGLYLSQAFAQLMGGSLTVQTAPGQGSTFTLRVPVRVLDPDEVATVEAERNAAVLAAQAERTERAEAVAAVAEGKRVRVSPREHGHALRVLVADDHPLALRLVTRLLPLHGFAVTPGADGGAARAMRTERRLTRLCCASQVVVPKVMDDFEDSSDFYADDDHYGGNTKAPAPAVQLHASRAVNVLGTWRVARAVATRLAP
jgi:hypothetical protein